MKRLTFSMALLAVSSLLQLARAAEGGTAPGRIAPPKHIPDVIAPQPLTMGEPVSTASIPKPVRRAVIADAARRFEVSEESVVLARAEQVTWSDGSLGCPMQGRHYTQARVPGYRITAVTASGAMSYHTDTRGKVVTCGSPPHPRTR